jgi:hypothetical protein
VTFQTVYAAPGSCVFFMQGRYSRCCCRRSTGAWWRCSSTLPVTNHIVVDIAKTARVIDSDPDAVIAAVRDRSGLPVDDLAEFRRLLARR